MYKSHTKQAIGVGNFAIQTIAGYSHSCTKSEAFNRRRCRN